MIILWKPAGDDRFDGQFNGRNLSVIRDGKIWRLEVNNQLAGKFYTAAKAQSHAENTAQKVVTDLAALNITAIRPAVQHQVAA